MIDPNTPTSCHLFRLVKKPQEPKGMPFRSTQRLELVPTRHLKVAVGREMSTDMDSTHVLASERQFGHLAGSDEWDGTACRSFFGKL